MTGAWIFVVIVQGAVAEQPPIVTRDLPEAQCLRMADEIAVKGRRIAACFGPEGQFHLGDGRG